MHSKNSDKNAAREYQEQQQHQRNSPICDACCNSKSNCMRTLASETQMSCFHIKRASYNKTTTNETKTTTQASSQRHQHHHLLKRYCIALPLIQYRAIRLSNCLWLVSSQLLPRVELNSAGYQKSSTAACKNKTTTTQHIISNTYTLTSSHSYHLQKRCLTRSPSLVLLTLLLLWFSNLIGSTCAAPQSCVLCDINDFKDQPSNAHAYEEYHFEHQVSRGEAITALKAFNVSNYGEPSGCAMSCSEKVMKYCLGQQFINDHCWCELGHMEEGLPFVPHICYVGDKLYKATVGSCYFYEQVKECCCAPALAKQWRHISAASQRTNTGSLLLLTILLFMFNHAHRHTNNG